MSQQPDDVTAKDSGANFAPHSEGQFAMVCVDVVNMGVKIETFPGQDEPREVPKVALVFVSGERQDDKEHSLALVTTEMTLSANEKANLRKFLESWRGRSYSETQAQAGLPITKLHGVAGLVSIEHVTTRKGRAFAKIASISPLPKTMPAPDAALLAAYVRPKFLADRKAQYAAALAKHRGVTGEGIPSPEWTGDEEDDDLPF